MRKIILLGYMGCGKSTVAKILAQKLQIPHFDLDEMIETKAGLSVKQLFDQKGEIHFRKLEHELFYEIVNSPKEFVLSLGGGAPCYANNHLLLQEKNVDSVYLKASIEELYGRLVNEKHQRPLIAEKPAEEMKEFMAKHLFERSYFYNQAKNVITVDGKSAEAVVEEIQKILL